MSIDTVFYQCKSCNNNTVQPGRNINGEKMCPLCRSTNIAYSHTAHARKTKSIVLELELSPAQVRHLDMLAVGALLRGDLDRTEQALWNKVRDLTKKALEMFG